MCHYVTLLTIIWKTDPWFKEVLTLSLSSPWSHSKLHKMAFFLCVVGPSNLVINFCGFKDFFIYTYMYMNLDVCILHIQTCTRTGVFNVWPQLLAILIRNLNHCKIHCKLLADIRWLEINWWTPQICEAELVKKEQYSNQYFPQHLLRLAKWHLFSVLRKCLLTLD